MGTASLQRCWEKTKFASLNILAQLPPVGVNCDRIDAALEQLMMIDAASRHSEHTGGRPSTLWSATAAEEQEENEALQADADELVTEEEGT
jgi:hypothetical protein